MKKIIFGFIIGSLLFSAMPIKAAVEEYILYRADYKVMVNGAEYSDVESPILNYKGTTYVPMRAVGDLFEANVSWNAELGQAEIKSLSTTQAVVQTNNIHSDDVTFTTYKQPYLGRHMEVEAVVYNGNTYVNTAYFPIRIKRTEDKSITIFYNESDSTQEVAVANNNPEQLIYVLDYRFVNIDLLTPIMKSTEGN